MERRTGAVLWVRDLPGEALFDDAEGVRVWARFSGTGEAPRSAVMLARRAVVATRLLPDGKPLRVTWIHEAEDAREYVALDVGTRHVTLVREDGSIVRLDARTGEVVHRWSGLAPVAGAMLLDLEGLEPGEAAGRPPGERLRRRRRRHTPSPRRRPS